MGTNEKELQSFLKQSRNVANEKNGLDNTEYKSEFEKQQEIYSKFSVDYDESHNRLQLKNHIILGGEIEKLFGDRKDINILDYGCGTGKVADDLAARGFTNVEGTEPNLEFLNLAMEKGHMKHVYQLSSNDNHDSLKQQYYDVVCSSSTFFLTSSHPGFECFPELIKLVKKGGFVMILSCKNYYEGAWNNHEVVDGLVEKGVLKIVEKKIYDGYRTLSPGETVEQGRGVILTYQVL